MDPKGIKAIGDLFLFLFYAYTLTACLWLPIVFTAYARGRGWWGTRLVTALAVAEIVAIAWVAFVFFMSFPFFPAQD